MQIVIDIPEEVYKQIKGSNTIFRDDEKMCYEAVQNGTPLPKGHGKIVDLEVMCQKFWDGYYMEVYEDDLSSIPTIIEADKGEE